MLNEETLKKHGLKAVPFKDLVDGDEFQTDDDFNSIFVSPPEFFKRKLDGDAVVYADGDPMACPETTAEYLEDNIIVYVGA